jgi:hypothetical protein
MTAQAADGVKVAFKTVMRRLVTLEEEVNRANREASRKADTSDMSAHSWMDLVGGRAAYRTHERSAGQNLQTRKTTIRLDVHC